MKTEADDIARKCLRLLLLPVMRFCLRRSLKLQEIVEVCKETLVEASEQEIQRIGDRKTVNRISIMTGIHRADVMRLSRNESSATEKSSANILNRLIAQWQTDRRFLSSAGRPRTLSFDGKQGEFAQLLVSVSSDPNPYTVLSELERLDAVEVSARGIKLKTPEFIVRKDVEKSFEHLSYDSGDLICAVEENIFTEISEPNLHLRTEYDNVDPDAVLKIRRWLLREGTKFHRHVREYLSRFDRDINKRLPKKKPGARIAVYSFSRAEEPRIGSKESDDLETEE